MQSVLQSIAGLRLAEARHLFLVPADGRVVPPSDFFREHLAQLAAPEQELGLRMFHRIPKRVPDTMRTPLVRSSSVPEKGPYLRVRRSGARSAFDPVAGIQFKGCRPTPGATFPSWQIGADFSLSIKSIPFGTMTAENVMRELLGWLFLSEQGLPAPFTPVAVLEYGNNTHCLALAANDTSRLEVFLDGSPYTTHDLLRLKQHGMPSPERETELRGIDKRQFTKSKVDYLLQMLFAGGFRGILNSNIGNDVIKDGAFAGICDLDTFELASVPVAGAPASAVDTFVKRALLETIKTSLPILAWQEVEDGAQLPMALAKCYLKASSFFHHFRQAFLERARQLGWDLPSVEISFREGFELPLADVLLSELIPNKRSFSAFRTDSCYIPHH